MKTLRDVTLVFLIKRSSSGQISDICLAMKKRGFGMGRWNGVGGKVASNETIEEAARRETQEEIGVTPQDLQKVAEMDFYFEPNPDWNQLMHVYLAEHWEGEVAESEEMRPQWYSVVEIPFAQMWPDDQFWLPDILKGNMVKASFTFGDGDAILKHEVAVI